MRDVTSALAGQIVPGSGIEPTVAELHSLLCGPALTSVALTRCCLARIDALDFLVNAVLTGDDTALDQARLADERYSAGRPRGPLDGIPILVKDNIETAGLATTAGSPTLLDAPPLGDAPVIERLRAAGAVILGKTNLTEWANFRSGHGPEGWSGVGGQTRNPYCLDRSPGGSSSGSAVAVAAGLAPLALGTETNGSIVVPAGQNGVVGIKPELGLLPAGGVVPVTSEQDVVGVLAPRVADAAACLSALVSGPPLSPEPVRLAGRRVGLWHTTGVPDEVAVVLDEVAAKLRAGGAIVVQVDMEHQRGLLPDAFQALWAEFRSELEDYLATRPGGPRTLHEIVAANRADSENIALVGQAVLEEQAAAASPDWPAARLARRRVRRAARALVDGTLRRHDVEIVLAAANAPAWIIDYEHGDPQVLGSSSPTAIAGYPAICVPAGFLNDLPVGVTVFGPSEVRRLLPLAAAVELSCAARRPPPCHGALI